MPSAVLPGDVAAPPSDKAAMAALSVANLTPFSPPPLPSQQQQQQQAGGKAIPPTAIQNANASNAMMLRLCQAMQVPASGQRTSALLSQQDGSEISRLPAVSVQGGRRSSSADGTMTFISDEAKQKQVPSDGRRGKTASIGKESWRTTGKI